MDEQNNVVTSAAPAPQGNGGLAIKIVSLALGVESLSGLYFGFLGGAGILGALISLACGIVAFILGKKGLAQGGRCVGLAKAGKICGLIGIILSALGIVIGIIVCAVFNSFFQ